MKSTWWEEVKTALDPVLRQIENKSYSNALKQLLRTKFQAGEREHGVGTWKAAAERKHTLFCNIYDETLDIINYLGMLKCCQNDKFERSVDLSDIQAQLAFIAEDVIPSLFYEPSKD